jgi:hypothetical protein
VFILIHRPRGYWFNCAVCCAEFNIAFWNFMPCNCPCKPINRFETAKLLTRVEDDIARARWDEEELRKMDPDDG